MHVVVTLAAICIAFCFSCNEHPGRHFHVQEHASATVLTSAFCARRLIAQACIGCCACFTIQRPQQCLAFSKHSSPETAHHESTITMQEMSWAKSRPFSRKQTYAGNYRKAVDSQACITNSGCFALVAYVMKCTFYLKTVLQRNLNKIESNVAELEAKLKHEQEKCKTYNKDRKGAETRYALHMRHFGLPSLVTQQASLL